MTVLARVDLPQPDSPTIPKLSPFPNLRETPSSARILGRDESRDCLGRRYSRMTPSATRSSLSFMGRWNGLGFMGEPACPGMLQIGFNPLRDFFTTPGLDRGTSGLEDTSPGAFIQFRDPSGNGFQTGGTSFVLMFSVGQGFKQSAGVRMFQF